MTEVCGVNLWDSSSQPGVSGDYNGWHIGSFSNGISVKLFDKGNGASVSGVYFGITNNGRDASDGVTWALANGNVLNSEIYRNAEYVSIYPKTAEALSKLLARYDVMVTIWNGTYPTTFEPYIEPTSYTTTLGRTVYGGTLDVVSGELVVDRAYRVFDGSSDESWSKYGTGARFTVDVSDYTSPISSTIDTKIVANYLQTIAKSGQGVATGVISGGDTGYHKIMVNVGIETIEEMRAYLADNPLQVAYPLATPQTYQLDPQTISLLKGNNNVWSDGEVELTYNADVGLYIDKKLGTSGTTSLSMTRTLAKSEDTDDTKSDNIQLAED